MTFIAKTSSSPRRMRLVTCPIGAMAMTFVNINNTVAVSSGTGSVVVRSGTVSHFSITFKFQLGCPLIPVQYVVDTSQ